VRWNDFFLTYILIKTLRMKKIRQTLLASVLFTFIASGCGPNDDKGTMDSDNSRGEGAIDSTRMAKFDTTQSTSSVPNFITQSIKSNIGEIKLSQLAQSKASSNDVKQLASMMINHHTQMVNELKGMAQAKQATVDSTESDITRAAYQNLSSAQGKDFDDKWRAQLLQLHENNSEELRTMQSMTADTILRQWLDKTIPIVEQHRNLLARKEAKQPNLQKGQTRD
jgi:putative membrane protein